MKPKSNSPKRRKPLRKTAKKSKQRKSRIVLIITPLALIVFLVLVVCSNFGNPGEICRGMSEIEVHYTEASEAGRRDAERVLNTAAGSMARDEALLYLHSRASALRLAGYDTAADDYITGAEELLRSRNVIKND